MGANKCYMRHSSCVWTLNIILTTWHSVDSINLLLRTAMESPNQSHFGKGAPVGAVAAHFGTMSNRKVSLELDILVPKECSMVSYGKVSLELDVSVQRKKQSSLE